MEKIFFWEIVFSQRTLHTFWFSKNETFFTIKESWSKPIETRFSIFMLDFDRLLHWARTFSNLFRMKNTNCKIRRLIHFHGKNDEWFCYAWFNLVPFSCIGFTLFSSKSFVDDFFLVERYQVHQNFSCYRLERRVVWLVWGWNKKFTLLLEHISGTVALRLVCYA